MPNIVADIEYLKDLPLYKSVKPYYQLYSPNAPLPPDAKQHNLEHELHQNIHIMDIRDCAERPVIDVSGFEVLNHNSDIREFNSPVDVEDYKQETERLLKEELDAEFVQCYELKRRKNIQFERSQIDVNDPLLVEGPARGAHNDVTYISGPVIINRNLSYEMKERYLQPGYRIRIINTWRSLLPVVEDRPLALCDSRSVSPEDLIAADRLLPDRVGEIYYLAYNPNHKWFWLEHQRSSELFCFVMYDTTAGKNHARFCPHVSFDNTRKDCTAPARHSVETRSIVITKI